MCEKISWFQDVDFSAFDIRLCLTMKLPQKERNLFTVDTVGAQNEFDDDDEYADFEMLYHVDGTKNIENTNNEEEEEDIGSFDDYGIDFGRKKKKTKHISK